MPALGRIQCDPVTGLAMPALGSRYGVRCDVWCQKGDTAARNDAGALGTIQWPALGTLRAKPGLFAASAL